jgi:hypothetical protein
MRCAHDNRPDHTDAFTAVRVKPGAGGDSSIDDDERGTVVCRREPFDAVQYTVNLGSLNLPPDAAFLNAAVMRRTVIRNYLILSMLWVDCQVPHFRVPQKCGSFPI